MYNRYIYIYTRTPCFSDVRGPFRTNNPKNIPINISYENGSYFLEHFSENHICSTSYIQKKTPNSNIVFKISIYNPKYNKHTKILSTVSISCFGKFKKSKSIKFYFVIYIIHNSIFVSFVYVVILIFVYYMSVPLYRTRVGPSM